MSKTPEPASPLPWRIKESKDPHAVLDWHLWDAQSCWMTNGLLPEDAAYIVHACNAYPGLVEERDSLKSQIATAHQSKRREQIEAKERRQEQRKQLRAVIAERDAALSELRKALAVAQEDPIDERAT